MYNIIARTAEKEDTARRLLRLSHGCAVGILVDSALVFCRLARSCGTSNNLLAALAKIGSLEQRFHEIGDVLPVVPAIYTERAEILWGRGETMEAIETLRALLGFSDTKQLTNSLAPMELILAKLVLQFESSNLINHRRRGRHNSVSSRQIK
jgi:hypothetical protein